MIKAAGKNRWQLANVGCQHAQPVGKAVDGGVFLGKGGEIAMFFNGGNLHLAKPVRHAQRHTANPGPKIEDPAAVSGHRRRQQHRIGANAIAVGWLCDLDRLVQQMVVRHLHHLHLAVGGTALGLVRHDRVSIIVIFLCITQDRLCRQPVRRRHGKTPGESANPGFKRRDVTIEHHGANAGIRQQRLQKRQPHGVGCPNQRHHARGMRQKAALAKTCRKKTAFRSALRRIA